MRTRHLLTSRPHPVLLSIVIPIYNEQDALLAYNPVIEIYRRVATKVRTEDEAPLTFADVDRAGKYFAGVQHREFWILTLSLLLKYFLLDRVHPNADRYWKRIFRESASSLWWWMPLERMDRVLTRIPGVRRLAWNMVMWGYKT
jgi:hypothetical protein